jgi:hypothetical protein
MASEIVKFRFIFSLSDAIPSTNILGEDPSAALLLAKPNSKLGLLIFFSADTLAAATIQQPTPR